MQYSAVTLEKFPQQIVYYFWIYEGHPIVVMGSLMQSLSDADDESEGAAALLTIGPGHTIKDCTKIYTTFCNLL